MKPTFKHYLSIAFALVAIFLSGYGIGFLLGERKGRHPQPLSQSKNPSSSTGSDFDWTAWEHSTGQIIEDLIRDLTPEQLQAIRLEITETSARIRAARQSGRKEFRDLNERLRQHLTPEQQAKLPGASPD
tara:strand:+ start:1187 stop:1576 length:390 start_codon:yes stop_codon:yes gene_type:complete